VHYFVDMHDGRMNFISNIDDEKCKRVVDANEAVQDILKFYTLGRNVFNALNELQEWSAQTQHNANQLLHNVSHGEQLVRRFLLEFRTCLDHMETHIKRNYGKKSALWQVFSNETSKAYDHYLEYAFTYHLRNYGQHCDRIVHGLRGSTGIGISSNVSILLSTYDDWKPIDKEYMEKVGIDIDLCDMLSKAFFALNSALKGILQHMLQIDDVGNKLLYLRRWGDFLSGGFQHAVNSFHIYNLVFADGSSAMQEDLASGDVHIHACAINWEMIYEFTDCLAAVKHRDEDA